ncbi:PLAC8 family-domain-containing protein [Aspergillus desertorum]
MAASEKTYRSRPIDPPTYEDTTPEARNITHNKEWNYSLFDCCSPGSLCFLTCCLPCLTFGRTQARAQDPTLRSYSSINSECLIFTGLTLCCEMREKHGIDGSCCRDCCATFSCGCCTLVQEEKEMELRTRPELTGCRSALQMTYP